MIIYDRIYGEYKVQDNVISDLISSKAMERLGKINQYGAIYQVYPQFFTTRREHSIGVMILLTKLGASLEEKIAGLLHDIPHTAFSHVIDYVFGRADLEDSYHEKIHREVVLKSDIPAIIERNGINLEKILNIDSFPLLERGLPDLCADRVDYIFRDLLTFDLLKHENIKEMIGHLVAFQNEIMIDDEETAYLLAVKSIEANQKIWSSPYQIYLAHILAKTIKLALNKKYIGLSDLHGTDNMLFRKLREIDNQEVQDNLNMMTKDIVVTNDENDYEVKVNTKLRAIDPKIVLQGKVVRLSEMNTEFKRIKEEYIEKHKKGFKLKIRTRINGEKIV